MICKNIFWLIIICFFSTGYLAISFSFVEVKKKGTIKNRINALAEISKCHPLSKWYQDDSEEKIDRLII